MRRRICSMLLCLCLLLQLFCGFAVLADEPTTGTVHVSDTLYVRDTPGGSIVGRLYDNDVVTILDTVLDKNGGRWYHITKGNITGYSSADYITLNLSYKNDKEFEAYLTAQGFPESYKKGLRAIYAQHPNWVFEARHLTMTWAEALKAETKVGLNTITSPDAWKSMEYGAYNWTTNSYVAYDSGGWVTASPALVAYYMDPRNFLDSTYIFQFEKLTFSGGHTVEGVKAILPDALDVHAAALLEAAKATNISAYFLAARMTQEGSHLNGLGTGTVKGYEGYYNFFHIGAYASGGNSAVTNGAIYAKNQGWSTPLKCITDSAERIARGYIRLGQDTNYFQKFNVTNAQSGLYAHQYMSNTAAAAAEGRIRHNAATDDELKGTLVFSIPVYKDMPQTVAPLPSKTGNNNNFLDSLAVAEGALTPSFDRYTTDYALHVGQSVSEITIDAKPNSAGATVTIEAKQATTTTATSTTSSSSTASTSSAATSTGGATTTSTTAKARTGSPTSTAATAPAAGIKIPLRHGENKIPITVKASSGETRVYMLTVTREGDGPDSNTPSTPKPTVTGTTYTIGSTVTKVEPKTSVADFIKNLAVKDGIAHVYTAAGQHKKEGTVSTGDILRLYSGSTVYASYPIVIVGDVNGDGSISSLDLRVAQKHILGIAPVTGYYLTAADSSKDGALTSLDLRITQKFILGITKTLQ